MKKIENIKEDDDELRRSLVKEYLEVSYFNQNLNKKFYF
jgi:hypothetical protein